MYQLYEDYKEGLYTTVITISKTEDGRVTASADGLAVTALDQADAVNQLQGKLQEAYQRGEILPVIG